MKLIRKFAVQGHEVPESAHSPQGPFPAEIMRGPQLNHEDNHADSLHEALDSMRLFRCRDCDALLYEDQLAEHECED
jgi:hypothetical protein